MNRRSTLGVLAGGAAALSALTTLGGCGFHLRGDASYPFSTLFIANEQKEVSPEFHEELKAVLGSAAIKEVPHAEFKQMTKDARAVIRTGEFTYYANIIIVAGVAF